MLWLPYGSREHGAWSREHGAWSREHGAWSRGIRFTLMPVVFYV